MAIVYKALEGSDERWYVWNVTHGRELGGFDTKADARAEIQRLKAVRKGSFKGPGWNAGKVRKLR